MGCVSWEPTIFFDENMPVDQQAKLYVNENVRITEFSGKSVDWTGSRFKEYIIAIPSGIQTVTFDINADISLNPNKPQFKEFSNVTLTANFEHGELYMFHAEAALGDVNFYVTKRFRNGKGERISSEWEMK